MMGVLGASFRPTADWRAALQARLPVTGARGVKERAMPGMEAGS